MSERPEVTELAAIRHDLKNVLTALRHGCTLIGSKLDQTEHQEAHVFLDEMLRSVQQGSTLVERLRNLDQPTE